VISTICKGVPVFLFVGFSNFETEDQATLIRLGQSSSRIMVAALHWFDADNRVFRNFLSWRSGFNRNRTNNNSSLATTSSTDNKAATAVDMFKQQLINFAESVVDIQIDQIEAAIVNVLLILATGKICNFHNVGDFSRSNSSTTISWVLFNFRLDTFMS
jgi:hypothetical protein